MASTTGFYTPSEKAKRFRTERIRYWDSYERRPAGRYYHEQLTRIYQFLVPPGRRVLELGCGSGDLLAALRPSHGVGLDFSPRMIAQAARRRPELHFVLADVHQLALRGKFDYVILSDLINDLWDVQTCIEQVASVCSADTRIIINSYSRLWETPLWAVRRLGLANPLIAQNWLTVEDIENLLYLTGFESIRSWHEILLPIGIPLLDSIANSYLARLFPFQYAALTNFVIARPAPRVSASKPEPLVSVIIPARNEAGNIPEIIRRVPEMGAGTELIFVEGNSSDDTYQAIEHAIAANPHRKSRLFKQTGKGKGDAVRMGFAAAEGEILMILDADMTMPPEDLPRFYAALQSGKGEFINGARLVYPMEQQAMRFFNLVANKFFSICFSWLLGQPLKDTLCGTKVLRRSDYEAIAANRHYFGDFDPYGDFDLLLGAAKLNLKFVDIPMRYAERTYGETNIARWRGGWILLRMMLFGLRRLKFY
ncbi:MAG TPA: glycosyltransferase [Candidatus Binataceae bacterium]|nr:glycosyltransferase [Candidatus Binataceae bacterium]